MPAAPHIADLKVLKATLNCKLVLKLTLLIQNTHQDSKLKLVIAKQINAL